MRTVLVQGAGGGGGNNWIRSLRRSGLDVRVLGSNCMPHAVAKSTAEATFLGPPATDPRYGDWLVGVVEREGVDLVAPCNGREVKGVSGLRDRLPCRTFLPPHAVIETCQDKHRFYERMRAAGLPMATSVSLEDAGTLEAAFDQLPACDRYWLRPRTGSGSKGAGWVRTRVQAEHFLSLWEDLRGFDRSTYQLSTFLPGADYAFQSIWHRGTLVVAKLVQRMAYFGGANRLSGMSSTPEIARTVRDEAALETCLATVRAVCDAPHGVFSMDLKCDAAGLAHVTEVNIGRCCMITTIFDETGVQNTVGAYVQSAFDEAPVLDDPLDIDEGWLLLRELDTEPLVVHESRLPTLEGM